MKNKILFGYRLSSADCCEYGVDDDGFSLDIYEDGSAVYQTYIFSNIPKKCRKFRVSAETVKEIRAILNENKKKYLLLIQILIIIQYMTVCLISLYLPERK